MITSKGLWRLAFLCLVAACAATHAAVFLMEGGQFLLNGKLTVEEFTVDAETCLYGNGTIEGAVTVHGALAPGNGDPTSVGILSIASSLVFNAGSVFACYASGHTTLDTISADGPVSGICLLDFSQAAAAIPLSQVVIEGGAGSDYAGFTTSTNLTLDAANNNLLLTDITGDSNTNHIPDYWEVRYFDGRTNCNPAADSDDDLMNNWAEYVAGTVPTNADSRLEMSTGADHSATDLVLAWSSVQDKRYTLLRATNLLADAFSVLSSNIAATPPLNAYTDSVIQLEHYYYRIQVEH
ncbi:MAG: hypothetical protein EOM20_00975 [Spartobacteria bacterium]|nr:hypothetical protein [Spartobacteria bacterium]